MREKKIQMRFILFLVCVFWFGQYVYIPYQATYLTEIGVSADMVGIIVGAYGLVQILCRIPVGVLADTGGGHKKIITLGISCVGIASLLRVLFPNAGGFFAANLFSGLGASAWISYMVYYMGFYRGESIQKATGKIIAANNTGVLLGFITSSALYTHLGMRWICAFSLMAGALGTVMCIGIREHRNVGEKADAKGALKPLGNKRLLFFSVLALLQQGVQMATCMSFTIQIAKDLGIPEWQVGMTSIVYIVFAVLFSYLSGKALFIRIGHARIVPVGLFVQAAYCLLVPNMQSVYGIYFCQILAAFAMGFLFTSLTSESMKGIPDRFYSTAMGIFQAVYAVGMTLFPMAAGHLLEAVNEMAAYGFLAACLIIGLAASVIFYRRETDKCIFRIR